jgi:hypothetical protein
MWSLLALAAFAAVIVAIAAWGRLAMRDRKDDLAGNRDPGFLERFFDGLRGPSA